MRNVNRVITAGLLLAAIVVVQIRYGYARQGPGSAGLNGAVLTTVVDRKSPVDGNGIQFKQPVDLGYKVYEDSGSASAVILKDELGNTPVCGLVHQVCIGSALASDATGYVILVDSAAAGGVALATSIKLAPPLSQITAQVPACYTLDVQWNNGLVLLNSGVTGGSYVYWRPCRGGRN